MCSSLNTTSRKPLQRYEEKMEYGNKKCKFAHKNQFTHKYIMIMKQRETSTLREIRRTKELQRSKPMFLWRSITWCYNDAVNDYVQTISAGLKEFRNVYDANHQFVRHQTLREIYSNLYDTIVVTQRLQIDNKLFRLTFHKDRYGNIIERYYQKTTNNHLIYD